LSKGDFAGLLDGMVDLRDLAVGELYLEGCLSHETNVEFLRPLPQEPFFEAVCLGIVKREECEGD
jgi:hypothetical protein